MTTLSESSEGTGLFDCLTVRSPRLLQRGVPKARTRGSFRISHVGVSRFEQFVRSDIFHYLANMPLRWMLLNYCVVYILTWLLFTFWWQHAANDCESRELNFRRAFLLSLETMTTIGYGVSDPMFDECPEVVPLLVAQSLIGLLMDAIFLNLMYTRFSTAFTRSASIIFTDVAIVYEENGFVKIAFRVCEVARKPLIEPMVRLYLIKHGRVAVDADMEGFLDVDTHQMALEEPDINIADGKLFLTLPTKVVHCLDETSPLSSGPVRNMQQFHDQIQAMDFFEVIVVLSGTCPITGNSLEARQSYTASDLRYNCTFAPCVSLHDDKHQVNFEYFHRTMKCDQTGKSPSTKLL
ncbi:unnamed protein product [Cladocopium goreaui]|uniref:G protein-activated inward rectifier potassium channel 2 n=2 Tax=Cladocopium goreaui TaxID=2562237 RepID=A0A9P1CRS8_9DINO|nr:unnamed protein product [Cladocopium goreaui]